MLWILMTIMLPSVMSVEFSKNLNTSMVFVDKGEILVTNDKWVVAVDINLDDVIYGFERILRFEKNLLISINNFRKVNSAREQSLVKDYVVDMIQDWNFEMTYLETMYWEVRSQFESLIYSLIPKKIRQKRTPAVPIIGKAFKLLFGTMDETDLTQITGKINKLEVSNGQMQHLIKEQLSYAPKIELVMKNQVEFAKSIVEITNSISRQADELWYTDNIRLHQHKVTTGIRMFTNLINKMKETSNILINALLTSNDGRIDPKLVSPTKLLDILKNVQTFMPTTLQLITPVLLENLHIFYDIGKASAYIIDHTIRLFIEIPLKSSEREFTIYKAIPIPIPIAQNNLRMKMKTDAIYLALSKNQNLHFEMNIDDYEACRGQFIKICPYNAPIYRRHNINTCLYANYEGDHEKIKENCEIILSKRNKAEWIKIDNGETWVHDIEHENLNLVCTGQEAKHISVSGRGTLFIPNSCEIHSDDYVLIQSIVGKSNTHPLEMGLLDTVMLTFLDTIANFTVTSMITIKENVVLDNILNSPSWSLDFSKGVDYKDLKLYMDKLENEKVMSYTNYRVIALYAILIAAILCYLGYLLYNYLQTVEFVFRRRQRRRHDLNYAEHLDAINIHRNIIEDNVEEP